MSLDVQIIGNTASPRGAYSAQEHHAEHFETRHEYYIQGPNIWCTQLELAGQCVFEGAK